MHSNPSTFLFALLRNLSVPCAETANSSAFFSSMLNSLLRLVKWEKGDIILCSNDENFKNEVLFLMWPSSCSRTASISFLESSSVNPMETNMCALSAEIENANGFAESTRCSEGFLILYLSEISSMNLDKSGWRTSLDLFRCSSLG